MSWVNATSSGSGSVPEKFHRPLVPLGVTTMKPRLAPAGPSPV